MSRRRNFVVGVILAGTGVFALRGTMGWFWWRLVIGAFQLTFERSPIAVVLSALAISIGTTIAGAELVLWIDEVQRTRGER